MAEQLVRSLLRAIDQHKFSIDNGAPDTDADWELYKRADEIRAMVEKTIVPPSSFGPGFGQSRV